MTVRSEKVCLCTKSFFYLNADKVRKKKRVKKTVAPAPKRFHGQVNCICNRKCAEKIDILRQRDIFNKFSGLKSWSSKVKFIRAIVKAYPVKENLNPIVQLKKRKNTLNYYISDSNETQHQVCLQFVVNLLQVNRTKIFRTLNQKTDGRGKYPHRKASLSDIQFMKSFIRKFPTFEACYNSSSNGVKYLHPNLNFKKMYDLYVDHCTLFRKRVSSNSFFSKNIESKLQLYVFKKTKPRQMQSMRIF